LYILNTFDPFVKVKVIVSSLPESFDTKIDLNIAVVAEPAVYNVVTLVAVKSTFAFLKLLAIKPTYCF
jgi:hypothetical protein